MVIITQSKSSGVNLSITAEESNQASCYQLILGRTTL